MIPSLYGTLGDWQVKNPEKGVDKTLTQMEKLNTEEVKLIAVLRFYKDDHRRDINSTKLEEEQIVEKVITIYGKLLNRTKTRKASESSENTRRPHKHW